MYHGVPAAGVLCVELLKHAKLAPVDPLFSPPKFSISKTIQHLSLIVGFLGWVKPEAANSKLCYRIRDILQCVLDRVLNKPQNISTDPQSQTALGSGVDIDLTDFDDYANFDLLDTFEWINEDWTLEAFPA